MTARAIPVVALRHFDAMCSWPCLISMACTASCRRWCAARDTTSSMSTSIDRPRHSGVSNYGFFDRLWIGIMDLAGVWWLIRRKKPTPVATEVNLMLIQFGKPLATIYYDVFVAKFDFWLAFGLVAQVALYRALFWCSGSRASAPARAWCRWRSGFSRSAAGYCAGLWPCQARARYHHRAVASRLIIYVRNLMLIFKARAARNRTLVDRIRSARLLRAGLQIRMPDRP